MAKDGNIDVTGTSVLAELFGEIPQEPAVAEEQSAAAEPVETTPEPGALESVGTEPSAGEEKPDQDGQAEEKPTGKAPEEPGTEKEPQHVPIAVVKELREDRRRQKAAAEELQKQLTEARIKEARLQGQLEALAKMQKNQAQEKPSELPPDKSPLEKFNEEFPDDPVPARVLLAQKQWENQQQEQATKQTQTQIQEQEIVAGVQAAREYYSADRLGSSELSLDAVVALAQQHNLITDQDKLNLVPFGKQAGFMLYDMAKTAIQRSGGAPLQELNRRVLAARATLAEKSNANKTNQQPQKPAAKPAKPVGQPAQSAKTEDDDGNFSGITDFLFRK